MNTLIVLTQRLNDLAWEIESKQKEAESWSTAKSPYPEDLRVFETNKMDAKMQAELYKEQFKIVLKQIEEAI
jgi:hypothetical protein